MSFLQNNKRREQRKIIIATTGVVVVFLLILTLTPLHTFLAGPLGRIGKIFWKGGQATATVTTEEVAAITKSKHTLVKENDDLRNQLFDMGQKILDRDLLAKENEDLKTELGRSEKRDRILAAILAKPNRTPYDTIVIDAGAREQIHEGAIVYTAGDVAIGTVREVSQTSTKVVLYSTPGEKANVRIEDKNIDIELAGRGGGNFEATLPREIEITEGMHALLPGITPTIVATVSKIISDARDPFQKIIFQSPVNIQELNYVYVAK